MTTIEEQRSLIEAQQLAASTESATPLDLTAVVGALEWAANQNGTYGIDEIALNDARGETLRDLAANLQAIGFTGVIEYNVHVGEFCMVFSEQGTLMLAADDLPLGGCLQSGWQDQEAFVLAERQTLAFANAVAQINGRAGTVDIVVEVVPRGQRLPIVPYPAASPESLAGEWNQRAAANHRVEIRLLER